MDLKRLFSKIPSLTTERLTLREITLQDGQGVLDVFNNPDVTQFNFRNRLATIQDAELRIQYWKTCYSQHARMYWGIFIDDVFIGNIGLVNFDPRGDRVEIGYNLSKAYWGKGYMKEALDTVMSFLFTKAGVNRIDALVLPGNENSIRLLQTLGFTRDGILRGAAKTPANGYEDVMLFGLLKTDRIPAKSS